MFHPCNCSRPGWMRLWVTLCRERCPCPRGLKMDDFLKFLPRQSNPLPDSVMLLTQLARCTPVKHRAPTCVSKGCPGTSAQTKTSWGSQEELQAADALVERFPPTPPSTRQCSRSGKGCEPHITNLEKEKRDYPEKLHKFPFKPLQLSWDRLRGGMGTSINLIVC